MAINWICTAKLKPYIPTDGTDADGTYARLGFRGETQINDQLTGYGHFESQFDAAGAEGSQDGIKTRLAFAGSITVTTLALTTVVTTVSLMTWDLTLTFFQSSAVIPMKILTASLLHALLALQHSVPKSVWCR